MQVTEVSEKAIQLRHPREVFFSKFPWPVVCSTCQSRLMLDTPEDVKYNTGSYGSRWLSFECSLCHRSTNLTDTVSYLTSTNVSEDAILIRGYRAYFPTETKEIESRSMLWSAASAFFLVIVVVGLLIIV